LQPLLPKFYLELRWGLREAPPALRRVLEGHTGGVNGVAFSPDGTLLATASADGTVALWDPATGQRTATLKGHTGPVRGVAFSPDGTLLATASDDRTVALWELDRRAMVSQLALGTPVLALAWHAGGLAVGTAAGDVVLLAVVDRDPGGRASCAHNGAR
jgi:WD40 repeat protein